MFEVLLSFLYSRIDKFSFLDFIISGALSSSNTVSCFMAQFVSAAVSAAAGTEFTDLKHQRVSGGGGESVQ